MDRRDFLDLLALFLTGLAVILMIIEKTAR